MAVTHDCIVIGSGPAGSAAAMTLARWGRDVLLVHDGQRAKHVFHETILDGAFRRLKSMGLGALVQEKQWQGTTQHGMIWGSDEVRMRDLPTDRHPGLKVDRAAFDVRLLSEAIHAGATVLQARVVSIECDDQPRIKTTAGTIRAQTIICCTGRRTTSRLLPVKIEAKGPPTIAMTALIKNSAEDKDRTLIEAVRGGWFWRLPRSDGQLAVTLFADLFQTRQENDDTWQRACDNAISWTSSEPISPTAATVFTTQFRTGPDNIFLAGDAVSSTDPLSSQGIEKALFSGEEAAYAANTVIADTASATELTEYLQQHERGLFQAYERDTALWYSREARFEGSPFWTARRAPAGTAPPPSPLPLVMMKSNDLKVADSFERDNRCLKKMSGWATKRHPRPITHVGRTELAPLLEIFTCPRTLREAEDLARSDPRLIHLRPSSLQEICTVLYQLGLIAAADPQQDAQ